MNDNLLHVEIDDDDQIHFTIDKIPCQLMFVSILSFYGNGAEQGIKIPIWFENERNRKKFDDIYRYEMKNHASCISIMLWNEITSGLRPKYCV